MCCGMKVFSTAFFLRDLTQPTTGPPSMVYWYLMVHTPSKHAQLTKTRAVNIQITSNWHLAASHGLWRWLHWLREGALLDVRRSDK